MKIQFLIFIIAASKFLSLTFNSSAQNNGEANFKQICAACHTVGKGRLVGPDLANIDQRQSEDWIIKFVKSSQTVIKGGDKYADSLFKAFNQVLMPDQPDLNDAQIKDVIAYIKTNSSAASSTVTTTVSTPTIAGDVKKGQDLFVGNIRFANNGPTCNSCHNVNMEGFISGGALAKDLSQTVTRLTVDGVKGVISGLPFPQMKQSYETKPLTEQEVADVTAFLKHADEVASTQAASSVGSNMLMGGIIGAVVLLILFSFFWIKRKQRTVNHAIYERQIKSLY